MEFILRGDRKLSNFSNHGNRRNQRNLSEVCARLVSVLCIYTVLPL